MKVNGREVFTITNAEPVEGNVVLNIPRISINYEYHDWHWSFLDGNRCTKCGRYYSGTYKPRGKTCKG